MDNRIEAAGAFRTAGWATHRGTFEIARGGRAAKHGFGSRWRRAPEPKMRAIGSPRVSREGVSRAGNVPSGGGWMLVSSLLISAFGLVILFAGATASSTAQVGLGYGFGLIVIANGILLIAKRRGARPIWPSLWPEYSTVRFASVSAGALVVFVVIVNFVDVRFAPWSGSRLDVFCSVLELTATILLVAGWMQFIVETRRSPPGIRQER